MDQDQLKNCPFCHELIQAAALKCRYCGEWLQPKGAAQSLAAEAQEQIPPQAPPPVAVAANQSASATGHTALAPTTNAPLSQQPTSKPASPLRPNRLRWVSVGFLLLSLLVITIVLVSANLRSPVVVTNLITVAGRILICAGLFAWAAWSVSGKRWEYALFTFSLVCTLMTLVSAYYFRVGLEHGERLNKESDRQFAACLNDLLQQATNGSTTIQFKPTGDPAIDAALQTTIELLNNYNGALCKMEAELAELNQADVFSPFVVTNKTAIESEIRKREVSHAIIKAYQQTLPSIIENARIKCSSLNRSENIQSAVLSGFDNALPLLRPNLDAVFTFRLLHEEAEVNLLRFLSKEFNTYGIVREEITFEVSPKQEEFNRLRKALEAVIQEAEAFQQRQIKTLNAGMNKINRLAE